MFLFIAPVTLCMIEGVKIYSNFNYEQCACHLESYELVLIIILFGTDADSRENALLNKFKKSKSSS